MMIRDGNPNWGPVLFSCYIVLSVFVLLNRNGDDEEDEFDDDDEDEQEICRR